MILKILTIILLFAFHYSYPQEIDSSTAIETKRVIPGAKYEANWLHRFFFGDHWRDLWTVPVEVKVLDLKKFAGGIKPIEKGGGLQTKSLRFENSKGIQYKFRSLDKDPSKTLPIELQESFASDIVQDQISSSNPLAPIIVPPILNAAGVLQAEPKLCILPDDEILGEYREEFGGLLGMIEIHPKGSEDGFTGFANSEKVESTFDLFDKLEKDNDEFVKSTEYLKARLVDIFLGDWDRHVDQWRWARFTENGKKMWYPIPRDRDQAFSRFDGIFPRITDEAVTQIEHFTDTYPDISDLTWSGRNTDRRFLHPLTKREWDSVTALVISLLTDSVITYAVKQLPDEMFKLEGENLINDLKSRRDLLKEASDEFYELIMKYVDIRGSSKNEYAEINRLNDNEVEVSLFKRDKKTGEKKELLYNKIFSNDITKEIRVLLGDGDDKAVIKGNTKSSIEISAAGDEGKDELIDSSKVDGFLFSFIPIPHAERKTYFYDSGKKTEIVEGAGTTVITDPFILKDSSEKYEPKVRDWGHDWRFGPWLGYNPDDGLFFGGGPILYEFGFRTEPYVYRMFLAGGYATAPKKFRFRYDGEFYSIIRGITINLRAKYSELEILNFFGFGNSTIKNDDLWGNDFYKVKMHILEFNPSFEIPFSKSFSLNIGTALRKFEADEKPFSLLNFQKPYGTGDIFWLNFNTGLVYDSRDFETISGKGFYISGNAYINPPIRKDQQLFGAVEGDIRTYLSLSSLKLTTLALRVSGKRLFGKYPFFESAFLGGDNSLRAFERNRFAGDGYINGNAELRLYLTNFYFLVPMYFGITGLADAGRVFYKKESSDLWHHSFGGGIWLSVIRPEYLFSLVAAKSKEDFGIYFTSGFMF